jgi:hypothetical protein
VSAAIPDPEWVTLPEAVALACPPLDKDDVRSAIAKALGEGRLQDRPNHILAVGDERVRLPGSTGPGAWERWFADGLINWETGEVTTVLSVPSIVSPTTNELITLLERTYPGEPEVERLRRPSPRMVVWTFRPELRQAEVATLFSIDRPAQPPAMLPESAKNHSGGRPTKHDWEGAHNEMTRLMYMAAEPPADRATMNNAIKDWFIGKTGTHPSDSMIREKVLRFWEALTPKT